MPDRVRTYPRLVGDTFRTLVTLGLLFLAAPLIGILSAVLSSRGTWELPTLLSSYLLCFVFYFVVYQLLTWRSFARADADQLARWARASTPRSRVERRIQVWTGSGVRSWAVSAALLALVAVVVVLAVPALRVDLLMVGASILVVLTSWSMVVYTFAVAYLRLDADDGGLDFPGGDEPVWSD